jgi:dipeptidase
VPKSFAVGTGDFYHFNWESGFWVFNWVANFAYSRYSDMIKDIKIVQREIEGRFFSDQERVEKAALALFEKAPGLAIDYLTKYSVDSANNTVKRWRKLGESLLMKYLDGNVRDAQGNVTHPGYPESWYRRVIQETGDHFMMKKLPGEKDEH